MAIVRTVPGMTDEQRLFMEAVAWGHDLLEDGVTELGEKVRESTLCTAGVSATVLAGIKSLSKEKWMKPGEYEAGLALAPQTVMIVKCCDRIANLTEGRPTFKEGRWTRYVANTKATILPLTEFLEPTPGTWLKERLEGLAVETR